MLDIINNEQLMTLNSLIDKITILSDKYHDNDKYHDKDIKSVLKVIEQLINKMIYL